MAQRNTKLLLAAVILGIGVSGALLFRKEASIAASGDGQTSDSLTYRAAAEPDAASAGPLRPELGRTVAGNRPVTPSGPSAGKLLPNDGPAEPRYGALPSLPPQYGTLTPGSLTESRQPQAPILPVPGQASLPRTLASPTSTGGAGPAAPPQGTHTIVDGDTLPRLAEQYLGGAERHQEIYALNRDLLRSGPDLLPIGAVLKIPAGGGGGTLNADTQAGAHLVPIPPEAFRRSQAAAAD